MSTAREKLDAAIQEYAATLESENPPTLSVNWVLGWEEIHPSTAGPEYEDLSYSMHYSMSTALSMGGALGIAQATERRITELVMSGWVNNG